MPYSYRKIRGKDLYKVFNKETGEIHANGTTLDKAKAQIRLLNQIQDAGGNYVTPEPMNPPKRGRPKKNKNNITMVITEKKRGRGRPKKGDGFFDDITSLGNTIKQGVTGAVEKAKEGIVGTAEKIKEGIVGTAEKAKEGVTTAVQKVKDTAVALVEGRTDYPPKVRKIIQEYGDSVITGISMHRTPLGKPLMTALQAASGNTFAQKLKNTPYDKLFHLFICIDFGGKSITLEKNEVINSERNCPIPKQTESEVVSNMKMGVTLNEALQKTKERMGGKFFTYSAKDNNCQDFIVAFLQSNGFGTPANISWVKQETKSLFEGDNNRLRKIANTLTDIGSRVDILKQGLGVKTKKGGMVDNAAPTAKILKALSHRVFTEYFTTTEERGRARDFILGLNLVEPDTDQGVIREIIRENWQNLRQFSSNPNYPIAPPFTADEIRKRNRGEELTDTKRTKTGTYRKETDAKVIKSSYRTKKGGISAPKSKPKPKKEKEKTDEALVDLTDEALVDLPAPKNDNLDISNIMFFPEDFNPPSPNNPNKDKDNEDDDFFDFLELGRGLKRKKNGGMMNQGNVTPLTEQQVLSIIATFLTQGGHQARFNALNNAIANIPGGNVRRRFRDGIEITNLDQEEKNIFKGLYDRILEIGYEGLTDTEDIGEGIKNNRRKLDLRSLVMKKLAMILAMIKKRRKITGGNLIDSVALIFGYILANELQGKPDVVAYTNNLSNNERLSLLRQNISNDGDDINDFAEALSTGDFTEQMIYDITRIVNDLINTVEEDSNTDYEDMDFSDFEGNGVKSSKVAPAERTSRIAPEPMRNPSSYEKKQQRQERRREAIEEYNMREQDPLLLDRFAKFTELRNMLQSTLKSKKELSKIGNGQGQSLPQGARVLEGDPVSALLEFLGDDEIGRLFGGLFTSMVNPNQVYQLPNGMYIRLNDEQYVRMRARLLEINRRLQNAPKATQRKKFDKDGPGGGNKGTNLFGKGIKKSKPNVKMENKWITYVKAFAEKHNMKYNEALKDPRLKEGYKSGGDILEDIKTGFEKVGEPYKALVGVNPATLGYELGYNVIGPAIAGKGRGRRASFSFGSGIPTNKEAVIASSYEEKYLGTNTRGL